MTHCPHCHTPVVPMDQLPRIVQQIEITQPPLEISEHQALPYYRGKKDPHRSWAAAY
jgi:hypothetical protein